MFGVSLQQQLTLLHMHPFLLRSGVRVYGCEILVQAAAVFVRVVLARTSSLSTSNGMSSSLHICAHVHTLYE